MARCLGNRTAHCRGAVGALGVSAPLHRKWGSRAGFSPEPPGTLALCLSVPEPHSPLPGCSGGAGRFHTASPEVGKPRGLFHQRMPGTLFYGSLSRNRTAHCRGAVGAQALPHHAAGNGSHAIKEKSGGNFLRFSDSRQGLLGAEDTVAGIAQAGNDVLVLVQMVIQGSAVDLHIGVSVLQSPQTLGSGNDAHELDVLDTPGLDLGDGIDGRTTGCQHGMTSRLAMSLGSLQ